MKYLLLKIGYLACICSTLPACNHYRLPNVNAGLWAFETTIHLDKASHYKSLLKHKRCISETDRYSHPIRPGFQCKKITERIIDNKYYYKSHCKFKEGHADMLGDVRYTGSSMQGIITIHFVNTTTQTKSTTKNSVKGRRIRSCKKNSG